ncbi:MAG TPA: hypothetical protein VFD67_03830, partial [Gemmatimonadaceae bacterium]|nr:hypothetical protein [Gemmatimonadaceae bacterium]
HSLQHVTSQKGSVSSEGDRQSHANDSVPLGAGPFGRATACATASPAPLGARRRGVIRSTVVASSTVSSSAAMWEPVQRCVRASRAS